MNTKTLLNLISDLDVFFQWLQELINSHFKLATNFLIL
jgi:hypothetical protein